MLYVSFQIFSVMDGYDENGLGLWCFREIDSTDLSLLIPAFLIFERHIIEIQPTRILTF